MEQASVGAVSLQYALVCTILHGHYFLLNLYQAILALGIHLPTLRFKQIPYNFDPLLYKAVIRTKVCKKRKAWKARITLRSSRPRAPITSVTDLQAGVIARLAALSLCELLSASDKFKLWYIIYNLSRLGTS